MTHSAQLLTVVISVSWLACAGSGGTNDASIEESRTTVKTNPFFTESTLPFNYPPFDQIDDAHYRPAFERGMAEQLTEVDAIANASEPPTLENTLVALERSGRVLDRVERVFFSLTSADTSDALEEIRSEMAPKLSAHSDTVQGRKPGGDGALPRRGAKHRASADTTWPVMKLAYARPRPEEVIDRASRFYQLMDRRRSVREFSSDPVSTSVIEELVRAASTAPSGAHKQPWTFVAVCDPRLKRDIRIAAEKEERANYAGRMPPDWLKALEPLGTDEHKPFLEIAPWLVVLFRQDYGLSESGERTHHYYVAESVGIAAGLFLAAVHHAGLVALTHTPSPMGFLRELLERPANETAMLLIPVGYPAPDAQVPELRRKALGDVLIMKTATP